MPDYTGFYLNSAGSVVRIECFELIHPSFSKVYRVVRNVTAGITLNHENGLPYDYQYCPLKIERSHTTDDLDEGLSIGMGLLGDELPQEFDRVNAGAYSHIVPVLKYRVYRSDDLTAPMFGPSVLEMRGCSFDDMGQASFEATAPRLNTTTTGEIYTLDRFPMLRGFL